MKVLFFCCKGFETMEFAPFVDVMGWARNDFRIDVDDYDALAIPSGFEELGFYEEALAGEYLAREVSKVMGY
jgi:4-methyl-5(b-hydroxyethyl)-thiazole monophosphate biosynthesis